MEGVTAVTAEEFQTLVLHQLQGLQQNIASLDSRMDNLNSQMGNLDSRMGSLDSRVNKLELQMDKLGSRVDDLESNLMQYMGAQYSIVNAKIEECIAIQQNDLMKLLEIIHEEMAAQEDVDYIVKTQAEQSKMLNLLSARSMQQEAELEHLRLAK